MNDHKFTVGQLVNYTSHRSASGVYQITARLPTDGRHFQYRIRNMNEPHERVVKEIELNGIEQPKAP